jgi:DNA-binding NarL/FixJ family response regulator
MSTDHQLTSVWVADSQFLIVQALTSLIEDDDRYSFRGYLSSKKELLRLFEGNPKGILIADINTLDFDNVDDFKNAVLPSNEISVLILTNSISKSDLVELTRAGFKNIVYKTVDRDELFSAVDATLKGKKFYSSELLDMMLGLNMGKQIVEESRALTASEIEIVKMVSQGFTTKEIAFRKNISFHTVNTHRKNIFRKMEVSNVSELIMKAIKLGWIDNIEYYI